MPKEQPEQEKTIVQGFGRRPEIEGVHEEVIPAAEAEAKPEAAEKAGEK